MPPSEASSKSNPNSGFKILGIDPGGTTGVALISPEKGEPGYKIIKMGELKAGEWLERMLAFITSGEINQVVLEDFVARPNLTDGRWTELPVAKQI